jgi:hypothetical protein
MTVELTDQETVRALRRLAAKGPPKNETAHDVTCALQARGFVVAKADGGAALTGQGRTFLRRALSTTGDFAPSIRNAARPSFTTTSARAKSP